MTGAQLPVGSLALFLLSGLRHGMEPDHVAAIDGMTLRALDGGERHAPWVGALFAVGHGLVVVLLAAVIAVGAASFRLPSVVVAVLDWLPIVLLMLLGAGNLRALVARGDYLPASFRMKLMPAALQERTDVFATLLVGMLFATVVDTVAHVSAWSVFAAQSGGWSAGLLAGLLFSAGFLITCTTDSQLVCRMLRSERDPRVTRRLRRGVGWVIVLLSFGAALAALAEKLDWDPSGLQWVGWLAAVALVTPPLAWAWRAAARVKANP
ncbi:MAG TPA: hypothetical protein VHA82_10280 [Ramlibacter sp.]|uniref:HoxN/HupN/NixA family nickel/cobalt transporter n=1 Tax=Ramlibacter sp. TaxID=1917967 RepID=UPI002CA57D8D|nr:hypothetical protein [Ramlibacter sp.]HVZ44183.1 hypothetical protein [Ramlibacter sp.]